MKPVSCTRSLWRLALAVLLALPAAAAADEKQDLVNLYTQADQAFNAGRFKDALADFERAAKVCERLFGPDHAATMNVHGRMGMTYLELGQYAKAEPLLFRGLRYSEAEKGKTSAQVGMYMTLIARVYDKKGEPAKAKDYFDKALAVWAAADVPPEEGLVVTLSDLASFYTQQAEYRRAEATHLRLKKIFDAGKDQDGHNAMANLNNLALVYSQLGEYAKAEQLLSRVVKVRESRPDGKDDLARSVYELSYVNLLLGQLDKAEALAKRALELDLAQLGDDHPETIKCLIHLGQVERRLRKYDQAAAHYDRALKLLEKQHGPDSPELYFVLGSIGVLQDARGQTKEAIATYERSLKMSEARYGADHPNTALGLTNLGKSYLGLHEPAKAEPYLVRALKIYEGRMGPDAPDVADAASSLAVAYAATERWDKAMELFDRAFRGNRRYIARILPALSEKEQAGFLTASHFNSSGDTAGLSVGVARAKDGSAVRSSAEWLLNVKGVTQQALAERSRLARGSTDPALAKAAQDLTAVRQQLAQLILKIPAKGGEKAREQELARLTAQEQELSKRLGQALGEPSRDDPWVKLEEVQKAVPKDAVLVEFAEFRVNDYSTWKRSPRFVAWVIPAVDQGDVQLIDLGDASKINDAVAAVRAGFRAAQGSAKQKSVILEKGEEQAEKELQPALAALAKLVLEPLAAHIGNRKQWILSPDGALWLTPWAALPLNDGSYAIEKYSIRYVVSGRDLTTPPFAGKVKRDPPLMVADPDFDLAPKEGAARTADLLGKQAPPDEPGNAAEPSLAVRSAGVIGPVGRLPGTAAEAAAIKPKLQAYTGEKPWLYSGKNALEGVVKAFHSPKVVILSTHGFFLEGQPRHEADQAADEPTGAPGENPLLRCGLLLATCNARSAATGKQEDGVLTGLEIVGCDLRGTELVVLSACETGLGEVRGGEGVAGLRQAFQLAGAEAVVASLWQVPDKDTALLMSDFFDGLATGKSKADALRAAQLARMKAHRDRDGGAHPFFWAAFTLTAQGK